MIDENTLEINGRIEKITLMRYKLTVACRGKFFCQSTHV
jgi:hypothetical protein